jgi:serine kinase of HPr protein (carbohydrate metabolism regulator)
MSDLYTIVMVIPHRIKKDTLNALRRVKFPFYCGVAHCLVDLEGKHSNSLLMTNTPVPPQPLIHASCLALGEDGVMLRGPSASGKSSLALRLIDQGADLVGDDYCQYWVRDGALWAAAQPPLAGLLEVRGIGVISLPYRRQIAVRAVIDLCPGDMIDRLPEREKTTIHGLFIPCYRLDPFHNDACAKVRLAVRLATGIIKTV